MLHTIVQVHLTAHASRLPGARTYGRLWTCRWRRVRAAHFEPGCSCRVRVSSRLLLLSHIGVLMGMHDCMQRQSAILLRTERYALRLWKDRIASLQLLLDDPHRHTIRRRQSVCHYHLPLLQHRGSACCIYQHNNHSLFTYYATSPMMQLSAINGKSMTY